MSEEPKVDRAREIISAATKGLSLLQMQRLTDWVNKTAKNKDDPCPHCGSLSTFAQAQILQITGKDPLRDNHLITAPYGTVVCVDCGSLRMFNLLISGVFEAPSVEDLMEEEPHGS